MGGYNIEPNSIICFNNSRHTMKKLSWIQKNIKGKTDLLKFSVTSYEKVLTYLREAMGGGGEWDKNNSFMIWKILDQEILDLSPPFSRFEEKYSKKFTSG